MPFYRTGREDGEPILAAVPWFEYNDENRADDEKNEQEHAFPPPGVTLIPRMELDDTASVKEDHSNIPRRHLELALGLLKVDGRLLDIVLDTVEDGTLINDELSEVAEELGKAGNAIGEVR